MKSQSSPISETDVSKHIILFQCFLYEAVQFEAMFHIGTNWNFL